MTSLAKILDDWAKTLSDKAAQKDTPLQESTDAFKAVTAYYAAQQKRAGKSGDADEPDSGGFNFANSGEVVDGESRQRKTVHPRRNS